MCGVFSSLIPYFNPDMFISTKLNNFHKIQIFVETFVVFNCCCWLILKKTSWGFANFNTSIKCVSEFEAHVSTLVLQKVVPCAEYDLHFWPLRYHYRATHGTVDGSSSVTFIKLKINAHTNLIVYYICNNFV